LAVVPIDLAVSHAGVPLLIGMLLAGGTQVATADIHAVAEKNRGFCLTFPETFPRGKLASENFAEIFFSKKSREIFEARMK
jgi:hypothetical protein